MLHCHIIGKRYLLGRGIYNNTNILYYIIVQILYVVKLTVGVIKYCSDICCCYVLIGWSISKHLTTG